MKADEVRFLFAYDRWATRRVLATLEGLGELDLINYAEERVAGSTRGHDPRQAHPERRRCANARS